MTIKTLSAEERNHRVVNDIIRQMQRGRSNAHGTFTLRANETTTTVTDVNCTSGSHVTITPQTANAAADQGSASGVYVVPGNQQFVVTHPSDDDTDKTFSYAIVG